MARLPAKIALVIMIFVDKRLAVDPYRLTKPLGGELAGKRTARNGDYRILLRIVDQPPTVWIIHVDHRAHAYRGR